MYQNQITFNFLHMLLNISQQFVVPSYSFPNLLRVLSRQTSRSIIIECQGLQKPQDRHALRKMITIKQHTETLFRGCVQNREYFMVLTLQYNLTAENCSNSESTVILQTRMSQDLIENSNSRPLV